MKVSPSKILILGYASAVTLATTVAFGDMYIPSAPTSIGNFNQLLGTVVSFATGFVGVIAVLFLIINGFNYITAGGNAKKVAAATEGVKNALIGVVIVVVAVLIVNYIMRDFLKVNLKTTTEAT